MPASTSIDPAHNPKVAGSNPAPASLSRATVTDSTSAALPPSGALIVLGGGAIDAAQRGFQQGGSGAELHSRGSRSYSVRGRMAKALCRGLYLA